MKQSESEIVVTEVDLGVDPNIHSQSLSLGASEALAFSVIAGLRGFESALGDGDRFHQNVGFRQGVCIMSEPLWRHTCSVRASGRLSCAELIWWCSASPRQIREEA